MPNIYNLPELHPHMAPAEAARIWMLRNACTSIGCAAIYHDEDGSMGVKYNETPHGIVILLKDGTGFPVPYRYDGSTHNLLH